jgi:hypothetical protein
MEGGCYPLDSPYVLVLRVLALREPVCIIKVGPQEGGRKHPLRVSHASGLARMGVQCHHI